MSEAQEAGVEFKLSRRGAGTVEAVAGNRNAESVLRSGVDAQLVGSARNRSKLHSCFFIAGTQYLPSPYYA